MLTNLMAEAAIPRNDAQILAVLNGLPQMDVPAKRTYRAGILNHQFAVYRTVHIQDELQYLHLCARMNVLGFSHVPGARTTHGRWYDVIFTSRSAVSVADSRLVGPY